MGNQKTATIQWAGQDLNFTGAGGSGFSLRFGGKSGPETASPMELVALAFKLVGQCGLDPRYFGSPY